MKLSYEVTGDFSKIQSWLTKASRNPKTSLDILGKRGVAALREATPRRTGETAAGWGYEIREGPNYCELYFVNRSHPNLYVNMAKLIETGHGTGTGGYVPPRPYIKQAMDSIFSKAADLILKEVRER